MIAPERLMQWLSPPVVVPPAEAGLPTEEERVLADMVYGRVIDAEAKAILEMRPLLSSAIKLLERWAKAHERCECALCQATRGAMPPLLSGQHV